VEDKKNIENPSVYNTVEEIYKGIVQNLDTIVACLRYHETRPNWYKERVRDILMSFNETNRDLLSGYTGMTTYIKLANSLKLRMAMHIVKVNPSLAQKWAEEAVRDGVVESIDEQSGLFPVVSGFSHPLVDIIWNWGDSRISASFESLLMSLDHPYTKYLITKNSNEITNKKTGAVLPANKKIVGIRSGILVGDGQSYGQNQRIAYSGLDRNYLQDAPLYLVKFAEVDFLRAEGALRGWNMGGSAQFFYERGIRNAYLEEPDYVYEYKDLVDTYMQREQPIAYVQSDPMGDGADWQSVTKIGVKWNDADSKETKLEKIITQKYIALFPLSTEAWTELRRTGYPKCFRVLNTSDGDGSVRPGEMIRRIPWQSTDPIELKNINETGLEALGGPDVQGTRLWWDVDAPNF
ncbi:MAG: SusD/RagB family nutrient-binding outer membrane lipoprotein, partial [Bacteroidales bacterium]